MKLKFITEEGLLAAKGNYSAIYNEILVKNNCTIQSLLNDDNIIRESSIEYEPFEFDMSKEKAAATDIENIKRVYNHLKGLTESQASDERIWVAFTLCEALDYMRYRWMPKNCNDKLDHFFFNSTTKRSLFRNGISRLWWIGYHTYDSNRVNPYELTEFICRDQDFINNLLDIGFASNPMILKACIVALMDAEKSGKNINRELIRDISQYINLLGGTYILDCLSYDEIYNILKERLKF